MTEKKKSTSRSQMAEPKTRTSEKVPSAKSVKTKEQPVRDERKEQKEQPKQESKGARKDNKSSSSLLKRARNSRIGRFALDAYYELRHKVTWPTFQEARNMTIAVIVISAVIGAILVAADFGLYHLFLLIVGR